MVIIVDNSLVFKEAEENYRRFETVYDIVKKSEADRKPINKATRIFIEMFCYDAFKIPEEIRKTFSGLNDNLEEMLKKGFLKLKKEDLSPSDPVTRNHYFGFQ